MTHYTSFMGNRKIGIVIPAACLTILTLGSVSCWGSADFSLLLEIFVLITITFSLITIYLHSTS